MKNDFWCDHPKTRLVYKVFSNGTINYYRQCLICLKPASDWISKKSLGHKTLGAIEDQQDGQGLTYPKTDREWKEHGQLIKARSMERYGHYLDSPEWKTKRKKALSRDHDCCQYRLKGCTLRATEVHHLTYANVPHEPIEDLISVCHHCHEIITKENRL